MLGTPRHPSHQHARGDVVDPVVPPVVRRCRRRSGGGVLQIGTIRGGTEGGSELRERRLRLERERGGGARRAYRAGDSVGELLRRLRDGGGVPPPRREERGEPREGAASAARRTTLARATAPAPRRRGRGRGRIRTPTPSEAAAAAAAKRSGMASTCARPSSCARFQRRAKEASAGRASRSSSVSIRRSRRNAPRRNATREGTERSGPAPRPRRALPPRVSEGLRARRRDGTPRCSAERPPEGLGGVDSEAPGGGEDGGGGDAREGGRDAERLERGGRGARVRARGQVALRLAPRAHPRGERRRARRASRARRSPTGPRTQARAPPARARGEALDVPESLDARRGPRRPRRAPRTGSPNPRQRRVRVRVCRVTDASPPCARESDAPRRASPRHHPREKGRGRAAEADAKYAVRAGERTSATVCRDGSERVMTVYLLKECPDAHFRPRSLTGCAPSCSAPAGWGWPCRSRTLDDLRLSLIAARAAPA